MKRISQDSTQKVAVGFTPFSCRRPSSEEHPGPPFVLFGDQKSKEEWKVLRGVPEDEVVQASLGARREEPEEELRKLGDILNGGRDWEVGETPTWRVSLVALLIGRRPAQLGPMSKSTSGIFVPST